MRFEKEEGDEWIVIKKSKSSAMYTVVEFATTINTKLVLSSVSLCVQDIEHVIVYKNRSDELAKRHPLIETRSCSLFTTVLFKTSYCFRSCNSGLKLAKKF